MTCATMLPCSNDCLVIGTYNLCIGGYDMGSTTGGLTLSRNAEYVDVRNDQSCTRQFRYLKQQDWSFTTTLQCVTLDKLRIIYGMGATYTDPLGAAQNSLTGTFGTDDFKLTIAEDQGSCGIGSSEEFDVTICGPGPGCGCRVINMPRVQITPETLDYQITKDNPVQLEVEFTILAECATGIILTMEDTCSTPAGTCESDPIPNDFTPPVV